LGKQFPNELFIIHGLLLSATQDPKVNFFQGTLIIQHPVNSNSYKILMKDYANGDMVQFTSATPIQEELLNTALKGPNVIIRYKKGAMEKDDYVALTIVVIQND